MSAMELNPQLTGRIVKHLTQDVPAQEKEKGSKMMTEEQKFVWWLVGFLDSNENVDIERVKEKLADLTDTQSDSTFGSGVVYEKNRKAPSQFENRRLEFLLNEEREKVKQLLLAFDAKKATGEHLAS